MNTPLQYLPVGRSAREIAASVESAVRHGELSPGDQLPAVRRVAGELGISPSTVAAAYRELHRRGIVAGVGRGGTRVRSRPPVRTRLALTAPPGTRNLVTGWPDPELLPELPPVRVPHRLYGEPPVLRPAGRAGRGAAGGGRHQRAKPGRGERGAGRGGARALGLAGAGRPGHRGGPRATRARTTWSRR